MSKVLQKFKRWISGLTAVTVLVSVLAPAGAIAKVVPITVNSLVTKDTTPIVTGYVQDTEAIVTVEIDGQRYVDDQTGDNVWQITVAAATPLVDGVYDVMASDGTYEDETVGELTIDTVPAIVKEVSPVSLNGFTNNTNPRYTFSSSEFGTASYAGDCGMASLGPVNTGANDINFMGLGDGSYANCVVTVLDAAGNESMLDVTPFVVDTVAPVLYTAEEFQKLSTAQTSVVNAIENHLVSGGVYVEEDYNEVTLSTMWHKVATRDSAQTSYEVTYVAEDLAGNDSDPVTIDVDLREAEEVAPTGIELTLVGSASVTTERLEDYQDAGANVVWKGAYAHVLNQGDLDTSKTGDYALRYLAEDLAPVLPAVESEVALPVTRAIKVVDTTAPMAVKNLEAYEGNGYVQLSWTNPISSDFAGVDIYRSQAKGALGQLIASGLSVGTNSYDDYDVVNGKTYYYTVVAFDLYGNSVKSVQVSATPKAPKVLTAATYGYYDNNIVSEDSQVPGDDQAVKSDETEKTDNNEANAGVSTVGIVILFLLIALGLYLLYLQNPEMFERLAFWKKNKKGSITIQRKNKKAKTKNVKKKN